MPIAKTKIGKPVMITENDTDQVIKITQQEFNPIFQNSYN